MSNMVDILTARVIEYEAEITALRAQVAALTAELDAAIENGEFMRTEYNATIATNERLTAEVAALTARMETMKEALVFYADPEIYKPPAPGLPCDLSFLAIRALREDVP